jgi:fructose-1,6-bisphosphatase I
MIVTEIAPAELTPPASSAGLGMPVGTTLDRYIMRRQNAFPYATGELSQLLRDIALASKIVNHEINRAGLTDIRGSAGSGNVQGETQQKLDVVANIRFIRALKNGGQVCAILSEEDDEMIHTGNVNSRYVVAIDPLDGSSNIDVNVSIGTIFSIYRRVSPVGGPATTADFLQGGRHQIAAGYVLYGTSTLLVYTTGYGVTGFTYDSTLGEYLLSHSNIRQPETGTIFSCNDGNSEDYPAPIQAYLRQCRRQRLTGRYIGSLVADCHRNLLKGGIYLYPPTPNLPTGKLRLLYECYPMAFITEQAGGQATNGTQPILDVPPASIHQRSVLYVGSAGMVANL